MAKIYNEIYKRQNEPEMQQLLVAQHFTYTKAKAWAIILFCVLVILPVGINVALYFELSDMISGLLAFLSLLLLGVGEVIRLHILKLKRIAAMLQQKFDLYVFDLNVKCGIDENIVAEQIEKYKNKNWDRKRNWYQNYESVDKTRAIYYCQKENIDWTGNLGKRYCVCLITTVVVLLILFFVNLIIHNSSIVKLLSIIVTALPLISYGLSGYKKISYDNKELAALNNFASEINDCLNENDQIELETIHILQMMIYKFRQTKYLIPDWFEKKFYKHLQAVESLKAKERIKTHKRNKK